MAFPLLSDLTFLNKEEKSVRFSESEYRKLFNSFDKALIHLKKSQIETLQQLQQNLQNIFLTKNMEEYIN